MPGTIDVRQSLSKRTFTVHLHTPQVVTMLGSHIANCVNVSESHEQRKVEQRSQSDAADAPRLLQYASAGAPVKHRALIVLALFALGILVQ